MVQRTRAKLTTRYPLTMNEVNCFQMSRERRYQWNVKSTRREWRRMSSCQIDFEKLVYHVNWQCIPARPRVPQSETQFKSVFYLCFSIRALRVILQTFRLSFYFKSHNPFDHGLAAHLYSGEKDQRVLSHYGWGDFSYSSRSRECQSKHNLELNDKFFF